MPDRSEIMFSLGAVIAVLWLVLWGLGQRPDGAVLGFAGTLMLVSGMHDQAKRKRERDELNGDDDDDDEDPTPHLINR